MKGLKRFSATAFLGIALLTGCNSDDGTSNPQEEFDRQALLTNYAENLIIPGYEALETEVNDMQVALVAFTADPSATTLATARQKYLNAYKKWQAVSVFEFGPADDQMLRNNLNIYPTSASEIEDNISSGSYDLQAAASLDAKGFPALDYLLYGAPTEAEILALYTTDAHAANRKKYLQDVASLVKNHAEATYAGWTDQNYSKAFKEAAGTAVGSGLGNLVNELNFEIDLTKRAKVGIPSGRFTAGTAMPDKVEAYYSQSSLELLKYAIEAKKSIFLGQSASTNSLGLDDYLDHVDARYNGQLLSQVIVKQFDAAIAAVEAVPAPLAQAVTANPQAVTKVYDELQKLIVLTKTDMPAALGVAITYNDNDGD